MKTITTLCLGALLSTQTLFAADFSKHSLEDLKQLSGKVDPQDALDYRLEINKRIENMMVKDARVFKEELKQIRREHQDKMTQEELRKYRNAVHTEMRKQIDQMTVKDARAKGVLYAHSNRKSHRNSQGKHSTKNIHKQSHCGTHCNVQGNTHGNTRHDSRNDSHSTTQN